MDLAPMWPLAPQPAETALYKRNGPRAVNGSRTASATPPPLFTPDVVLAPARDTTKTRDRVMMVAFHFEEYSFRLAAAVAVGADVLLALETDRLVENFVGRERIVAPNVTMRNYKLTSPLDALKLAREILRFRPAALHIQEPSGLRKAIVCAALVFLVRRFVPIMLTVHDPIPHAGRDTTTAARLMTCRRYVRRAAKTIFVHGDYCRQEYLAVMAVPGQAVVEIDHGEILTGQDAPERGNGPLSLLCFGRMEAYKGIAVLHAALALANADGVEFDMHVAGCGQELDRLADDFARMPNVRVENRFIPAAALIEAIRGCDGVVLPYLEATQSGVLAAAFANGRFVIASAVGGLPDIVTHGENGLLVPPGDAAALADAIRMVAENQELRRKLQAGARKTATERLDWRRIAETVRASY